MSAPLQLRRAAAEDCTFVWETNNHPTVREQSIRKEAIAFSDHERWYTEKLRSSDTLMWIALLDRVRVGVVRCDVSTTDCEISLAVVPTVRGRGLGTAMIRDASTTALASLPVGQVIAHVRAENAASRQAFERAGFVADGETTREGVPLLRFRLERP